MRRRSEFVDFVLEQMAVFGRVEARSMFGGYGVYRDGRMFAIIADDRLYLKINETTRAKFERKGLAPFTYAARGKVIHLQYFEAPPEVFEDTDAMREWAQLAYGVTVRERKVPAQRRTSKKK